MIVLSMWIIITLESIHSLVQIKKIIHAHRKLTTSKIWGDGHIASANKICYVTPQRSLYCRRFGSRSRNHILQLCFWPVYRISWYGCFRSISDSLYLLEWFLNQPSELTPNQIMTNTVGYSEMFFGLFGLLGFQFSPWIANDKGTKLWQIDSNTHYGELDRSSQNTINLDFILMY